jgi:myosin heavy subunit
MSVIHRLCIVQLAALLGIIRATTPHYVRCIKPNAKSVPKLFERANVVQQVRGLLPCSHVSCMLVA